MTATPTTSETPLHQGAMERVPGSPRPPVAAVWWSAMRPKTLAVGIVPVAAGSATAAASGQFSVWVALSAAVAAIGFQIGCNFVNDAADHETGADAEDRLGPARAAAEGWLTTKALWIGSFAAFAIAGLAGLYLLSKTGWPLLVMGLASLGAAIAYTAGPRLGYRGLGDLMVFLFFGFVAVVGTDWAHTGAIRAEAFIAAVPVGALATAVLVVNNLRDRHSDTRAGKRTLAVRFGERFARMEYGALLAVSYVLPATLVCTGTLGLGWLAPLVTLPLAFGTWRAFSKADGAALNPLLGATARLEVVYVAALCLGLLFGS